MENKHKKRSFAIEEVQIKTIIRQYHVPTRIAKIKKNTHY